VTTTSSLPPPPRPPSAPPWSRAPLRSGSPSPQGASYGSTHHPAPLRHNRMQSRWTLFVSTLTTSVMATSPPGAPTHHTASFATGLGIARRIAFYRGSFASVCRAMCLFLHFRHPLRHRRVRPPIRRLLHHVGPLRCRRLLHLHLVGSNQLSTGCVLHEGGGAATGGHVPTRQDGGRRGEAAAHLHPRQGAARAPPHTDVLWVAGDLYWAVLVRGMPLRAHHTTAPLLRLRFVALVWVVDLRTLLRPLGQNQRRASCHVSWRSP
jgi:hypothetical protein